MKHTKGTWQTFGVKKDGKNVHVIAHEETGATIAITGAWDEKYYAEEEKANATLISAAPELLEALKLCTRVLRDEKVDDGYRNTALTSAFSAISKAEGK